MCFAYVERVRGRKGQTHLHTHVLLEKKKKRNHLKDVVVATAEYILCIVPISARFETKLGNSRLPSSATVGVQTIKTRLELVLQTMRHPPRPSPSKTWVRGGFTDSGGYNTYMDTWKFLHNCFQATITMSSIHSHASGAYKQG
jgi:hypothetical protein